MEPFATLAFGVDLHLVATEEGGRATPLLGGTADEYQFNYRPNWGLPGWANGEQTAGPVFGFSQTDIHPGEDTSAILVALFPEHVPAWHDVQVGDTLRMYEGSRICGHAEVRWIEPATWPSTDREKLAYVQWLGPA